MNILVLAFVVALLFTLCTTSLIIKISFYLKLFDVIDRHRKKHRWLIPRLGGIGMIVGISLTFCCFRSFVTKEVYSLLSSIYVLLLLGIKDDLLGGAKPGEKFIMQLTASLILVFYGDLSISSCVGVITNDLFTEISIKSFLVLTIMFFINAFNFLDGIDGLAGLFSLIINLYLSSKLFLLGADDFSLFGFIVCGAATGFLRYNFLQRKIFMGDAGAMMLGIVSIVMAFKFIQFNDSSKQFECLCPVAIVFALLIVPIFDTTRIVLIRTLQRRSFLVGDRNHIHHRLKDLGMSDGQVVLLLVVFTVCAATFVLTFQWLGDVLLIGIIIILAVLGNTILTYLRGLRLLPNYKVVDIILKDTLSIR